MTYGEYNTDYYKGIFFLENKWKPTTLVSRIEVTQLPIEIGLYIWGIVNKYRMAKFLESKYVYESWKNFTQKDWKR